MRALAFAFVVRRSFRIRIRFRSPLSAGILGIFCPRACFRIRARIRARIRIEGVPAFP